MCLLEMQLAVAKCGLQLLPLWSLAELCGLLNCTKEKGYIECKSIIHYQGHKCIYNLEVKSTREGHLSTVHAF